MPENREEELNKYDNMSYDNLDKEKEGAITQLKENLKQQQELHGVSEEKEDSGIEEEQYTNEEGNEEDSEIIIEQYSNDEEEEYEEEEIELDETEDDYESNEPTEPTEPRELSGEEETVQEVELDGKTAGKIDRELEDEIGYSSEATGIDLYYDGKLYNSEDNISERVKDKYVKTGETEKKTTQTNDLSSINLSVIIDHVNEELNNKGVHHLNYYLNIRYSTGRFEDNFLTEVNAWVKYRTILKNGKGESDNTYLVTIPLGEDDMMMFDNLQESNEYLSEITQEDMEVKTDEIKDYKGLKYMYFKSDRNDRLIKEEMDNYKDRINQMSDEEYNNLLGEHFDDEGNLDYREEVPVEDKEELDDIRQLEKESQPKEGVRPKEGGGSSNSEETNQNNPNGNILMEDEMSPEPEYIKVSVEDVITQLRKRDIAMGGTHQYVDRKHENLKSKGVTDVYLKNILFEYEWDRLEELNNVSRLIYFYYDLELVTSQGIITDRYTLKVPLDILFKGEDVYYVSKGQFKDLIVNTESLIDEFKKEDYFRYLYKGISIYLGTKGGKQYKEYLKENGIKKVQEEKEQPKLGNETKSNVNLDEADEVNNLEDMAELVRRVYNDVHSNVEPAKLKKAYEMFNIFLRKAQKEYKGRINVQPHTKYEGLWLISAEGGSLLKAVNIGEGTREKNKNKEEHLLLHPFFAIASNGDNISRVIYKRRTTNMSLGDYEAMLVYNGYDELTDIAQFMNLKNYSKVIGFNNKFINDTTKNVGRQASRATGRAIWKGGVWAGKKLVGVDSKKRRR